MEVKAGLNFNKDNTKGLCLAYKHQRRPRNQQREKKGSISVFFEVASKVCYETAKNAVFAMKS